MIVLVDQPDDGLDERGWVSTDATSDAARGELRPLLLDPDLLDLRLAPEPVWLKPESGHPEAPWERVPKGSPGSREFWEFNAVEKVQAPEREG